MCGGLSAPLAVWRPRDTPADGLQGTAAARRSHRGICTALHECRFWSQLDSLDHESPGRPLASIRSPRPQLAPGDHQLHVDFSHRAPQDRSKPLPITRRGPCMRRAACHREPRHHCDTLALHRLPSCGVCSKKTSRDSTLFVLFTAYMTPSPSPHPPPPSPPNQMCTAANVLAGLPQRRGGS